MSDGIALVTGAARGLGAAIAQGLRAEGWRVAGVDLLRSETDLSIEVDVAIAADVAEAVRRVENELGAIDVLVTAAGIYEMLDIEEISDESWERMLSVNIGGTANTCAAVVPRMVERGRGSVVMISSDLGYGGSQGDAHYAATKGAIVGLTRSLALEVQSAGVAVNTVAPGAADTPMLAVDSPWRADDFLSTIPVQRLVRPDEIAAAVLFIVRSGQAFVGQVVSPNCGATI
ncbi:SDR family NAD(P)-dependent oxidoreductase [Ornithinimicrobium sediminis]|uniref:SDR family NAD(P)-dependent oxidoreductase n=1 Tax=Ornithinimicrobium sediminis TaxID=2904603 RepID=UPI001E53FBD0|nr:SDR family oxidoreductase [Ornithinimicrobium sediminis]MCE0488277.1 SDR family oxidoreductase [Ornithinimicrobium sediminis]